jgi:UDP-N-acetylglucosamine 2-epimerase (non-hydrolysing)
MGMFCQSFLYMSKKILSIFGTRPEAIKMAMLVKALNDDPHFEHKVCVTAQHREMLDQVMDFFEIEADFDLDLMLPGQDLYDVTSKVLLGLRDVFQKFRPDMVLVHGDTTTSMAGALAAFYAGIPVGHVEAGLRTFNLRSPFPEEANRSITGKIATWHFAPTARNVQNLIKEGVAPENIFQTGNTVIDSLIFASKKVSGFSSAFTNHHVRKIYEENKQILLVTGHRRENFGKGFIQICEALASIANLNPTLEIVYPVHLNPNVQKPVNEKLGQILNVHLIEPLSYPDFVYAMKQSWAILTDSGGVQEEAPSLGKPVLVMRETTERPEAVEAGTVTLVGADKTQILSAVSKLINDTDYFKSMSKANNPYGDGKAAKRIMFKIAEI